MINLRESMGLGWERTHNPWIFSQTRSCCQTRYQVRYAARWIFLLSKVNPKPKRLETKALRLILRLKCMSQSTHFEIYN